MNSNLDDGFIKIAKEFMQLVRGELQPYTSGDVRVVVGTGNSVSVFAPAHIHFAKYGRAPGKMPPVEPLIEWVKKKGIVKSDKEARGTAWAIAKSISKKGTKNYVRKNKSAIEEALDKGFENYADKLAEHTGKVTLEQLQILYEDILPNEIKL